MISTVEYSTVGVVHSVRVIDSRSRRRGAAGCVRDTCRVPLFVRGRGARLQGRNLPDGVVHEKPICFQMNDDGGEREGHKRRRRRRAFSLSRPKIERERNREVGPWPHFSPSPLARPGITAHLPPHATLSYGRGLLAAAGRGPLSYGLSKN